MVISKEAVGNAWDILNAILGHKFITHLNSHIKRIKPNLQQKSHSLHQLWSQDLSIMLKLFFQPLWTSYCSCDLKS